MTRPRVLAWDEVEENGSLVSLFVRLDDRKDDHEICQSSADEFVKRLVRYLGDTLCINITSALASPRSWKPCKFGKAEVGCRAKSTKAATCRLMLGSTTDF